MPLNDIELFSIERKKNNSISFFLAEQFLFCITTQSCFFFLYKQTNMKLLSSNSSFLEILVLIVLKIGQHAFNVLKTYRFVETMKYVSYMGLL